MGDFPISLSVTGTIGNDGVRRGEVVAADGAVLDLESISAVYYRRPTRFRLPDHLSPADRRFAEAEAHRGLGGLLAALPARWVSHPARIADAEAKPVQLQLAPACGFQLPRTLISNDPDRVREFADEIAGPLVYKPLSSGILREPDGVRTIYATRIEAADVDDWLDPDAIRLAPHQFQECVTGKAYDLRVAMTTVDLSCAYVQSNEIDEAAWLLGDAGEIAADNSSARLIEMVRQVRADLRPWEKTAAVRALDDRLMSHGVLLT